MLERSWRKTWILLLILLMAAQMTLIVSPRSADAAVAPDFQASVMGPLSRITDWSAFHNQLVTLKNNGVYAITTDVWWGYVEYAGDNQFDWSYYQTYADVVRQSGLKWIPILSTHKCGGNVGDDCDIPLPSWLWSQGTADEMKFKGESGYVNDESLSPFWSGIERQYSELYASFAAHFANYSDLIPKIYLSAGPAGELRFPSYYAAAGWSYPGRGEFQVYTESAKQAFRDAMLEKYGSLQGINQAWGLQLSSLSQISPPTDRDGFYLYGGYQSVYGKDFLRWYQSVLEQHLRTIAGAAHASFDPVFHVPIGVKIAGIHWQMNNPSMPRSAEHAAGYVDYDRLIQVFKEVNVDLTFTCLEMFDSGTAPNYSLPSTLVDTVSAIANAKGVRLNGENALPTGGSHAFQQIASKLSNYGYTGFTLLRLQHVVNSNGSPAGEMANFKRYIVDLAQQGGGGEGNIVTIYYKKGYSNPYIHYRPEGGQWTSVPGVRMEEAEIPGYAKITIQVGTATWLEFCFNDGNNNWDSNNQNNYFAQPGIVTYTPGAGGAAGTVSAGAPSH
ncbi:beta-amylase [Xylanibacillus composti]|nr:beta-amylase [Xylanibacillus composti]